MNAFLTSARHEMLGAWRTRTAQLLLVVFLGMVTASSVIGWITNRTVTSVYERILADGFTTASNPFTHVSPLYYARNSVIYVVLIGALMAIVLGAQATLRDRKAGTADLVLSRPIGTASRLLGQLAGIGVVLAAVITISMSISWVIISVINGAGLGWADSLGILGFSALALVLLLGFASLGMLAGIRSRHEATALLVPFVIWSILAFVLPQIGTAARPVSLLNPVPAVNPTGGYFDFLSALTAPVAVTEQFKRAAGALLQDPAATGNAVASALGLVVFLLVMAIAITVTPRARMRRPLDD